MATTSTTASEQECTDTTAAPAGTCAAGDEHCPGVSGMFFGELPCADCWFAAPASAHVHYHEITGWGDD